MCRLRGRKWEEIYEVKVGVLFYCIYPFISIERHQNTLDVLPIWLWMAWSDGWSYHHRCEEETNSKLLCLLCLSHMKKLMVVHTQEWGDKTILYCSIVAGAAVTVSFSIRIKHTLVSHLTCTKIATTQMYCVLLESKRNVTTQFYMKEKNSSIFNDQSHKDFNECTLTHTRHFGRFNIHFKFILHISSSKTV